MSDDGWGPWKFAAIGMALVMLTALVTGLVVANWTSPFPLAALPMLPPTPGSSPQTVVDGCSRYAGDAFAACLRARGHAR